MVKDLPANVGDIRDSGSIPELGRFPGGGHGNPLQYSCLDNPMDRGALQAIVHGVPRVEHDLMTKPPPYVCSVAQSCPTLFHPMDYSLQGSSVHGIFQARILEWVAISSSRDPVYGPANMALLAYL